MAEVAPSVNRQGYDVRFSKRLAIIQTGIGIICCIAQAVIFGTKAVFFKATNETTTDHYMSVNGHGFWIIGYGFWSGSFFIITGVVAGESAQSQLTKHVKALMVLSMLAAGMFVPALIVCASLDILWISKDQDIPDDQDSQQQTIHAIQFALNILLLCLAMLEFMTAAILSSISCRTFSKTSATQEIVHIPGQVQHEPEAGCQVTLPSNEPPPYTCPNQSGQYGKQTNLPSAATESPPPYYLHESAIVCAQRLTTDQENSALGTASPYAPLLLDAETRSYQSTSI